MRKTTSQEAHGQADVDWELTPTRLGSNCVAIESDPIPFESPVAIFPAFVRSAAGVVRRSSSSIWGTALLFIVALVAVELSLRTIEPRLVGRVYSTTLTGGKPIAMNGQGFRGETMDIPKALGVIRILALGDSVTFGVGVAAKDSWPAQLQEQMQTDKQPVEVLNAGLPYLDLEQIEQELEERWLAFAPDQAVIAITGNMISFGYASRDWDEGMAENPLDRVRAVEEGEAGFREEIQEFYLSFALPSFLGICMDRLKYALGLENHQVDSEFPIGVMLAHGYQQLDLDRAVVAEAWSLFEQQLGSLKSKAEQLGIPLTVIYSPPRFMLSESWCDNLKSVDRRRLTINPIERTAAICQRLGIPFLDPRTELAMAKKPVYVLSDYTHFDANGHQALAALIATSLHAH
jgi:lysophospholipase L1-like esterase